MLLDLPTLGTAMESAALMTAYRLLRPDPRNIGVGHNRIWAKADKVDSKFSVIKEHVTLRRTFGKYWIAISIRDEWVKNWPNQLRKGHVWFNDRASNQQGTGAWIWKYQSKLQWHISGQDATAFQARVAAILDLSTSCLRKRLAKEQITICTDSQVAVAALGASGTKSHLVADCVEKMTALSEVNQVTIMSVPGPRGIQ